MWLTGIQALFAEKRGQREPGAAFASDAGGGRADIGRARQSVRVSRWRMQMIERGEASTFHAKRFILRRGVIAVFFGIVFAAATALAQSVTWHYDRAATFSNYKTYAWTRGTELPDANHERVVRAIDAALAGKGLALVEATASPDVLVAYHANVEIDASAGLGAGQRVLVATLAIDLSDARTGATVWHSLFSSDIRSSTTAESRGKKIAKATETMFKNYPPKPERPAVAAQNTRRW
jgi:Domain of unknown function (DUF4136)